jgi:hypothetical protein
MYIAGDVRQVSQLPQQKGILEDALNRLDEERFEGRRVLLIWIA